MGALPTVLLTGFEPYVPGLDVNPSWEIVRPLDGLEVEGWHVAAVRLPVAYGLAAAALARAVEVARPQAIVSFGMHRRGPSVDVERRFRFASRDGEALEPGESGEPPHRASLLPVERVLSELTAAGFTARASDDAGLFVCEHTGFTAIGIARRLGLALAGFVHVPAPDQLEIARQLEIPRAVLRAIRDPEPSASA